MIAVVPIELPDQARRPGSRSNESVGPKPAPKTTDERQDDSQPPTLHPSINHLLAGGLRRCGPGYEFEAWWGLLAPAGTPSELGSRLNAAVNAIAATSEYKDFLLKEGALPNPVSPNFKRAWRR